MRVGFGYPHQAAVRQISHPVIPCPWLVGVPR
jgi:hypothetical protein